MLNPLTRTAAPTNNNFTPPSTPPRSTTPLTVFSSPERKSPNEPELFIYFKPGDLIYGHQVERKPFIDAHKSKSGLNAITIDQVIKVFYRLYVIVSLSSELQSMRTLADYNAVFSKVPPIVETENRPTHANSTALPTPTFLLARPIQQAENFLAFLLSLSKYSPIQPGGKGESKRVSNDKHSQNAKIRRTCKAGILYAMEETRKHPENPLTIHFLIGDLKQRRIASKQHQNREDFAYVGSELRFIFRLYKLSEINPADYASPETEVYKKLQNIVEFCSPIRKCVKFYNRSGSLIEQLPWKSSTTWDQYKPKSLENKESLLKFYDTFIKKPSMPSAPCTLIMCGASMFPLKPLPPNPHNSKKRKRPETSTLKH